MGKLYPDSKVEITGFEARFYDCIMNIMTLGAYSSFINKAIKDMNIQPEDKIIDLGCGTGRNTSMMLKYLSEYGSITCFEISPDMIEQFKVNCLHHHNVKLVTKRIDGDLGFDGEIDKAFISFVLHGLPHDSRMKVIDNVYKALKSGGEFQVLDYNEFDLKKVPFYVRAPFKALECKYAFDFIEKDWKNILTEKGFGNFSETYYFGKYVRLLKAKKI